MSEKQDKIGQLIDDLESITVMVVTLPFPPAEHIKMLKEVLPQKVAEFKSAFVELTGENPWGDE